MDGSSQEDENLKSKMDGYKTSPQSGQIIPSPKRMDSEPFHKVDRSPRKGRIILLIKWTDKTSTRRQVQTRSTIIEFKCKIKNSKIKTLSM